MDRAPAPGREAEQDEDLSGLTRAELWARAAELDIAGGSTMTRDQLADAVSRASRPRRGRRSA